MPARLTFHFSDRPASIFLAAEAREYLLGRGPECDVVVDDARVSRRHARLTVETARAAIVDLGSKNGIEIDGMAVADGELGPSSWLSLGGLLVHVECAEDLPARHRADATRRQATLAEHLALSAPEVGVSGLVQRLLESCLQISDTERGFVLLAGRPGGFEVVASAGIAPETLASRDFSGSVSTVDEVLRDGRPVIRSDARLDPLASARPSIVREQIRALVCLPLLAAGRTLGAVYADSRRPGKSFGELDVDILSALATHAALAMWAAGLKEELEGLSGHLPTRVAGSKPAVSPLGGFPKWDTVSTVDGGGRA